MGNDGGPDVRPSVYTKAPTPAMTSEERARVMAYVAHHERVARAHQPDHPCHGMNRVGTTLGAVLLDHFRSMSPEAREALLDRLREKGAASDVKGGDGEYRLPEPFSAPWARPVE